MGWMGSRGEEAAEALGRWVGISVFAFCADCGQPRKLLRSSSGAKSRGESHAPASSPITSSPALARGRAATPPTAPSPTMTTSVFLRSMAMAASLLARAAHGEAGIGISRLPHRLRLYAHALLLGGDGEAQAGIAEHVPADEVGVAAVIRIAERALDGVGAHEREERRGVRREAGGDVLLHLGEHGVLVRGRELREDRALLFLRIGVERREVGGVARARAAQRPSERAVDVMRGARLG